MLNASLQVHLLAKELAGVVLAHPHDPEGFSILFQGCFYLNLSPIEESGLTGWEYYFSSGSYVNNIRYRTSSLQQIRQFNREVELFQALVLMEHWEPLVQDFKRLLEASRKIHFLDAAVYNDASVHKSWSYADYTKEGDPVFYLNLYNNGPPILSY